MPVFKLSTLLMLPLLSLCLWGCSDDDKAAAADTTPPVMLDKKMFIILSELSGDLKTAGSGTTGPDGADKLCQADSQNTGGTYKALLSDGVHRVACTTADCSGGSSEHTDWVLTANTRYLHADDDSVVIGTTNENAIFEFPIENSFAALAYDLWMGLNTDWTTSANTCSGFTDDNPNGQVGTSNLKTSSAINRGTNPCNYYGTTILCVEQ